MEAEVQPEIPKPPPPARMQQIAGMMLRGTSILLWGLGLVTIGVGVMGVADLRDADSLAALFVLLVGLVAVVVASAMMCLATLLDRLARPGRLAMLLKPRWVAVIVVRDVFYTGGVAVAIFSLELLAWPDTRIAGLVIVLGAAVAIAIGHGVGSWVERIGSSKLQTPSSN